MNTDFIKFLQETDKQTNALVETLSIEQLKYIAREVLNCDILLSGFRHSPIPEPKLSDWTKSTLKGAGLHLVNEQDHL